MRYPVFVELSKDTTLELHISDRGEVLRVIAHTVTRTAKQLPIVPRPEGL